ncbi:MAG: glutamate synthase, partial [Bacillales bacterium]|nr:glutamate synthase [Bacillales bacterium]
ESIKKRIAKGAVVVVQNLNNKGVNDVTELLSHYADVLKENSQPEEAASVEELLVNVKDNFVQIIPKKQQEDPSVATE